MRPFLTACNKKDPNGQKLFFKLSDCERMRSHVLHFDESSVLQRNGNNNNLVPVTSPVKDVFPHMQKRLKPLVASLDLWRGSNEIFGMPKGGLGRACLQAFADVLHAPLSSCCCPQGCVVVCCCPLALLSGFAVNLNLDCVHQFPLLTAPQLLILP